MFNTRILCYCFSFLVLNAENQKIDTINLLDQNEKRNHTLWIKLESHTSCPGGTEITTKYSRGTILWTALSKTQLKVIFVVLVCTLGRKMRLLLQRFLGTLLKCLYQDVKMCWLVGISWDYQHRNRTQVQVRRQQRCLFWIIPCLKNGL